ncbi:VWA domain-containing protein [Erythrobacter sp.]|uniref:vWA domain-containing protein n=1 Tax=Erythrobacter sp. TaxID=1042 RepID=UPI001425C9A3|nr:VWA domain-containing protein [Erythrobacter sp.]QIQ85713.1 MAG: VWA domain-containing protein [Erythrobacter sp.]
MTDVTFTAEAAFDRSLFWERGKSVRYCVARLRARRDGEARGQRTPLNIALVIDASGSMGGGKLEAAKQAAAGLAERLGEGDRLSLVSFASDVQVHCDSLEATHDNAGRIRAAIAGLETRGMTHLSGGWFAGVECAARIAEADPAMTPRVIILSDGHANEGITDAAELREHAGELRLRGVLTSCLGIGDGYDEHLLRGLAESGGGRLHDAELTSEISSVLLGELDDIFGTIVEDAAIDLAVPAGVEVEPLGLGNTQRRPDGLLVSLGPVQNDVERIAVFKVTCPTARARDELEFRLTASARAVDDGAMLESDPVILRLAAAEGSRNTAQPRDVELAAIVARIWSADVVSTAARMNRDGAFREARDYVRGQLRHFARYVDGLDGAERMVRELELLARSVERDFSPRMQKEMVLQSALLMESRKDYRGADKAAWAERLARGD